MIEPVEIDKAVLRKSRKDILKLLNQRTYSFYETLDDKVEDDDSGNLVKVIDSYVQFLTVYDAFHQTISASKQFGKPTRTLDEFLETYSLYAGAVEGKSIIEKIPIKKESRYPGRRSIDFTKVHFKITQSMIESYLFGIENSKSLENLVGMSRDFYDWIIQEAEQKSATESFADFHDVANDIHIKVNGVTINGIQRGSSIPSVKRNITEMRYKHIVGNNEMINTLKKGVIRLMYYDTEGKRNILEHELGALPRTYYFFGRPGQGKSATLEATFNYAQRLSQINNKPLEIIDLSNFKSSFYSKSQEKLHEIFNKIDEGKKIYILVIEDIESVFPARSNKEGNNEDNANIQVIMNKLEGAFRSASGNYMLIATTNYPISKDDALPSRLREKFIEIRGPETSKDYSDLFKIKLTQQIQSNLVNIRDSEWKDLGTLCQKYDLAGRDVKNIQVSSSDYILEKAYPSSDPHDENYAKDYTFNKKSLQRMKKSFNTIDKLVLEKFITTYQTTYLKAGADKFRDDVNSEKMRILAYNTAMAELKKEEKI